MCIHMDIYIYMYIHIDVHVDEYLFLYAIYSCSMLSSLLHHVLSCSCVRWRRARSTTGKAATTTSARTRIPSDVSRSRPNFIQEGSPLFFIFEVICFPCSFIFWRDFYFHAFLLFAFLISFPASLPFASLLLHCSTSRLFSAFLLLNQPKINPNQYPQGNNSNPN